MRKSKSARTLPLVLALCGLALALACGAMFPLAPVAPVRALDPTLDAAIGAIAQATARARERIAATQAAQSERATAQAVDALATAQAVRATSDALALQSHRRDATATAQAMDTLATAQAVSATSDALALQTQRRDATATSDAQIASAGATATARAALAQATGTAIAARAEADERASQDAYNARLAQLFWTSFVYVTGALALVSLSLFALAENRRRRAKHAAEMQLLEGVVKERLQDFCKDDEDSATGRVVIDVVQSSRASTAGQTGDSEASPDTVIVHDDDAEATIGKILDVNYGLL